MWVWVTALMSMTVKVIVHLHDCDRLTNRRTDRQIFVEIHNTLHFAIASCNKTRQSERIKLLILKHIKSTANCTASIRWCVAYLRRSRRGPWNSSRRERRWSRRVIDWRRRRVDERWPSRGRRLGRVMWSARHHRRSRGPSERGSAVLRRSRGPPGRAETSRRPSDRTPPPRRHAAADKLLRHQHQHQRYSDEKMHHTTR